METRFGIRRGKAERCPWIPFPEINRLIPIDRSFDRYPVSVSGRSHAKRDFQVVTSSQGYRDFAAFCCAFRYAGVMDVRSDIFQGSPDGFHPRDVSVRLARPDERIRWDRLMDQHHYLGFKRFAGRGLRYFFEWRGQWVGLAGWQSGAFKCRPRDRWIGWKRELQFTRMHLIANNTRFLILGAPGCFLASLALAAMVQRLSADWFATYGHSLLLAETFVDPSKFCGHMYKEAGWTQLGRTKGYARANGRYTDPHGVPKDLHVFSLHCDTRSRMCAPDPLPDPLLPNPIGDASEQPPHGLSSVYEEFLRVPDFRRAQGRKHTIASVFAIDTVAGLAGFESGIAVAQFAPALNQTQLNPSSAFLTNTISYGVDIQRLRHTDRSDMALHFSV